MQLKKKLIEMEKAEAELRQIQEVILKQKDAGGQGHHQLEGKGGANGGLQDMMVVMPHHGNGL